MELKNEQNEKTTYAVEFTYWSEEPTADLYCDGYHIASSKVPAVFSVPNGEIEVAAGSYGINRMHYVTKERKEYTLYPDRRSFRGLRMRFHNRFPRTSSLIGTIAVITLLVSLVLSFPQLIETVTQIPWVSNQFGQFSSPITLPLWANITLITLAILAGYERALMLRNHWLVDMETSYWDS